MTELILKGVTQNNLKNVDLKIPLGTSIIVTGPSGSGKSSLAFETIYAEGQRRYMQSLSTYARQFLEKFQAPRAESIQNIPPTIALEQINPVRNSRATVGTTTEIYDYLRLLFSKIGVEYCSNCNVPMERVGFGEIFERIKNQCLGKAILVTAEQTLPTKTKLAQDVLAEMMRAGFSRILVKDKVERIEGYAPAKGESKIQLVIDRIKLTAGETIQTRLTESLRSAMDLGKGVGVVYAEEGEHYERVGDYTLRNRCASCGEFSDEKSAISFSFNSPVGACAYCKGFGNTLEVDPELVIPNSNLSLARGAIDPFTKPSLSRWQKKMLDFAKENRIDADLPFRDLPDTQKRLILDGNKKFKGVRGVFRALEKDKYKMQIRVFVSRYTSPFLCKHCEGARLNTTALRVRLKGKNIAQVCELTIEDCMRFLKSLELSPRQRKISEHLFQQLNRRLDYLNTVGLGYLTLSRLTRSLSGGEYQRILLATQLSQGLTDTLYVLDEPSIGLHPRDTDRLMRVLDRLLEQGNSLIVVEHDPEMIEWGRNVVELGPGSGLRGGQVIFTGTREQFVKSGGRSAHAVRDWRTECASQLFKGEDFVADEYLEIKGASGNNLKNIDVKVPLRKLVVVTGVSGSGKSTLVVDTLYQALQKVFTGRSEKIERFESISGVENLNHVELVDQSPIGKTSRSNPITFVKGYDEIRSIFANTPQSVSRGLTPGHFSFNVVGGRCDACEGEGRIMVDMVFMEDVWIPCETCRQKRFKPNVLAVRYRGKSIDDVLHMTIDEALDFFSGYPGLRARLSLMTQVGLGYLQLGQPGFSLSGGEAQRLKIARELSNASHSGSRTLFILDEPTTGLHFDEVTKLIGVLRRLVLAGNTVVVIEHNLQLICAADYLIDLGPEGGTEGGNLVACGTPREVARAGAPYTGSILAKLKDAR
ncbi:MAG: excinuclease ABC subunit UvrA [Deltaproteobacteria bacterium]|nr:excinuclease ABC subunit UvrA [Deltaproteobacteria bacterium]MBI3295143.1 excinuclease ABC subunit UvrA [Deltaproteobacteria bacterium]